MYKYLFGPVPSRRLGMSLGVDLVPFKICTLDCVYCECGLTTKLTLERKEYILSSRIKEELTHFFENSPKPDFITLTGSGEPTLNTKIGEIIDFCKANFSTKVAVLTNGTLFYEPQVRKDLLNADVVLPSFDAAKVDSFKKINKPHNNLNINNYLQGLIEFRNQFKGEIWLEILILPDYNNSLDDIIELKKAIEKIKPNKVQLNTLDRPGAIADLKSAPLAELKHIVELWQFTNVEIVSRQYNRQDIKSFGSDIEQTIIQTIKRRPCTIEDLIQILGLDIKELNKYLSVLASENKIYTELLNNQFYYKTQQL